MSGAGAGVDKSSLKRARGPEDGSDSAEAPRSGFSWGPTVAVLRHGSASASFASVTLPSVSELQAEITSLRGQLQSALVGSHG